MYIQLIIHGIVDQRFTNKKKLFRPQHQDKKL